ATGRASEPTRGERGSRGPRERACWGVRGAKPSDLGRRLVGARMESGSFQFSSDIGKCTTGTIAEGNRVSANQSIHIERPETNTLHMKRANGVANRGALLQKRISRLSLLLRLHLVDQHLQMVVGSLSVIASRHIDASKSSSRFRSPVGARVFARPQRPNRRAPR